MSVDFFFLKQNKTRVCFGSKNLLIGVRRKLINDAVIVKTNTVPCFPHQCYANTSGVISPNARETVGCISFTDVCGETGPNWDFP